jgi:dihydroxyacetone kinase
MEKFTVTELKQVLRETAQDMKGHVEELRELDAQLGDGDLGITMNLFARGVTDFCDASGETDVGVFLYKCGLGINKMNPSTFGTILAVAFMGAGKSVKGKSEIDIRDLAEMGDSAVADIQKRGNANRGDKTMLDALMPAIDAYKTALRQGESFQEMIESMVAAGEAGMKSTADMISKIGRARMFGEKSLGIQDGGATATYYILESVGRNLIGLCDESR